MTIEDARPLAIVGAGGLGRELAMLVEQINAARPTWRLLGFFDDGMAPGSDVNGLPVLGGVEDCNAWPDPLAVCVALGWPHVKAKVLARLNAPNLSFPALVHPAVVLASSQHVEVGEGVVICGGCHVTTNVVLGAHVLLSIGCVVGHDAVLGDGVALMPLCCISGHVTVGARAFLGTGAKVIEGRTVGSGAIVGAGAIVVRDLPDGVTAVGVPARITRGGERRPGGGLTSAVPAGPPHGIIRSVDG